MNIEFFKRLCISEEGAAASEYAILVAVVAVAVYAAIRVFDINAVFTTVDGKVSTCVAATGATC